MIVEICDANTGVSAELGEIAVDPAAVDATLGMVKAWGLQIDGEYVNTDNLFGEFSLQDGRVVFSITHAD